MSNEELIQNLLELLRQFTQNGQSVKITISIPENTILVELS